MATVNKASLRAQLEALCAAGKMSAESRALVDALLVLLRVRMAVFMEKATPKSRANVSLPASHSPDDATARTRPGAKGKGPSTNAARCAHTREHTRRLTVDACARCGEDLTDTAATGHERRTLVDIVFENVVRHADADIKHCPRCHTETRAHLPAVGADEEVRDRHPPVRHPSRRRIHQPSRRARPANEQGQAESLRVLPHPQVR